MNTPLSHLAGLLAVVSLAAIPCAVRAQNVTDPNFASGVVTSGTNGPSGLGSNPTYNDPNAALGRPTTLLGDGYHASVVYPAYGKDAQENNTLVSLGTGGSVTVQFATPIVHSDLHWYGDDFIVFGNSFFSASLFTQTDTDMATDVIGAGGAINQNGTPIVSVSSNGTSWVTVTPDTPWYPTNPYSWDASTGDWGPLQDFTKPVDPSLALSTFGGNTVAYADDTLYDGSAGGAAFSLAGLVDANGNPIDSIQYIRFSGDPGGGTTNIDAVSRVSFDPAAAPEPSELAIFALGGVGLIAAYYRRKRIN